MPVLSNIGVADKARIKTAFLPFARPDYVEGMVIGDDLDSLLSAMYLHQLFGWPVAGVYCGYARLWFCGNEESFLKRLYSGRFFAVDLDICHPSVPSLGHHIIAIKPTDELPGHTHTLNPNAIRGYSAQQDFRRKYPLATIHFLRWLFEEKEEPEVADLLTWLADSSYINAQQYRNNVEEWVHDFMPLPAFIRRLPDLQMAHFEQDLQEKILLPMSGNSLCHAGRSRYTSRHLGLSGFQCQIAHPNTQNTSIQSLLELLSALSGWQRLPFPTYFDRAMRGKRREIRVHSIPKLADWLLEQDAFSYAITYKDHLNYTVF